MDTISDLWNRWKLRKPAAESRNPHCPKILNGASDFKIFRKSYRLNDCMTLGPPGTQTADPHYLKFLNEMFNEMLTLNCFNGFTEFPKNLLALTLGLPNFHVGNNCHDFRLGEEFKEDGHFTYKMLSKTMQAVYFNDKNRKQFLAGITFYPSRRVNFKVEKSIFILEWASGEPFPLQNRGLNIHFAHNKKYTRHCKTAGCRVIVNVWNGKLSHYQYDPFKDLVSTKACAECAKDYQEYKFEKQDESDLGLVISIRVNLRFAKPPGTATDLERFQKTANE